MLISSDKICNCSIKTVIIILMAASIATVKTCKYSMAFASPGSEFFFWEFNSHPGSVVDSEPGRNGGSRLEEKLIEGTRFTAHFVWTYHFVLLVVLVSIAFWRRIYYHVGKQTLFTDGSSETRSLQYRSHLLGSIHSTHKNNELTPLLNQNNSAIHRRGFCSKITLRCRSIGLYQPRPTPIINKTLPSISTILIILAFLGINIFYLLFRIPSEFELAAILADRAAVLFVSNLPWLYLLGAKNQPISLLTGVSYERLNILHRRLGEFLCLIAVFHFVGMTCAWYSFLLPRGMSLSYFLTRTIILFGIGTFASFEILYLTSLTSIRDWSYEFFLRIHVLLQVAALLLLFLHHKGSRIYVAIAAAIFAIDRIFFRLFHKSHSVQADLTIMDDGNTVLISANWPLTLSKSWMPTYLRTSNLKSGWQSAEHCFITIPKLTITGHPFTIASAAPEHDQDHAWFNLIVRARDGFTKDLLRYAQSHSSVKITLDGPYGSSDALDILNNRKAAILIAGGSGIAVIYPLLWKLVMTNPSRPVATTHCKKPIITLVWVMHEASHLAWIGHERLDELKHRGVNVVIPTPTAKGGRPDMALLVQDEIGRVCGGDKANSIGVVVSGPDGMNATVRNACSSIIWDGWDIALQVEKFGW